MLYKNQSGMTLVEVMISAGIVAFLSVGAFKLMGMMNKSNKKSQNRVVNKNISLRMKRILDNSVKGLDSSIFEKDIFYEMDTTGKLNRKSLVKSGASLENFNPPVGRFSSFSIVKKQFGMKDGLKVDRSKNYDTICIPKSEARTKITYSQYKNNFNRRPFIKVSGGNKTIYCCKKSDPNCSENESKLAHEDSLYVTRVVAITKKLPADTDELETIPAFGELKDITGVGFFLYTSVDNPNLLTSGFYYYNSDCFNKQILFDEENVDNCEKRFKVDYQFSGQLFDQSIGIGVNDLGSELEF